MAEKIAVALTQQDWESVFEALEIALDESGWESFGDVSIRLRDELGQ